MKKGVLILLLALVLLSAFSVSATRHIDREIQDKLDTKKAQHISRIQNLPESPEEMPIIIQLKPDSAETKGEIKNSINFKEKYDYSSFNGFSGNATIEGIEKLAEDENVEGIYYDRILSITLSNTRSLSNATLVWPLIADGLNLTGRTQTACILDTGINYTHIALGSPLCTTANFPCGRVISGYDYVHGDGDPYDDHGHGTHVAGIIASNDSTYTGMAPEANIIAIKVCNSAGGCPTANILSGLDWCIQNSTKFNITVISMSLGDGTNNTSPCDATSAFTSPVDSAYALNISVVIAAGNTANFTGISDPACIQNATAVSSVTKSDAIASYSSRSTLTDIFAYGSSITSTYLNGDFASMSGTSMATPHVSGALLLLNQYKKAESNLVLTPAQLSDALNNTGSAITDSATGTIYHIMRIYSALVSIDNKAPEINITSPGNATYYLNQSVSLNYTAIDTTLNTVWYNLDNGTNYTLTANTTLNTTYGFHQLYLYANDSNSNLNITNINFTLFQQLDLDIISPANTSYNSRNMLVNISSAGAENIWFWNGTTNITYTSETYANFSEGFNAFLAYSNNSQLSNISSVNFTIDITQPYIAITQPAAGYYTHNIYINLTNSSDINSIWFFNGTENATYTVPLYINLSDGYYNITAYANDSANNINSSTVNITIDLTPPGITVNSPASTYHNSDFTVSAAITDEKIGVNSSYTFYRWENSSTNSSWTALANASSLFTATFSISSVADGFYTIRFNTTDLLDNTNTTATTAFTKDTVKPYLNTTANISSSVSSTSATITFHTNESSNVTIRYGTDLNLSSTYSTSTFETSHSYTLSSLTASTLYYYNITFCDRAANCNTTSGANNFTTYAAVTVTSNNGGAGGGGGSTPTTVAGSSTKTWPSMEAGVNYEFVVDDSKFKVEKISITPNRKLSDVQLVLRQLNEKPSSVLRTPDDPYSYFEVAKVNILNSDIQKASITFTAEKSWVDKKGSKEDIKAMRYVPDRWEEIGTRFIREEGANYVYEADTPGFSYFAIALEKSSQENSPKRTSASREETGNETIEDNSTDKTSSLSSISTAMKNNWWVWLIIAAILVLGILAYKYAGRIARE